MVLERILCLPGRTAEEAGEDAVDHGRTLDFGIGTWRRSQRCELEKHGFARLYSQFTPTCSEVIGAFSPLMP